MKFRVAKNYYYDKAFNRWRVRKTINGVRTHFGIFRTEEQAKRAVELFDEYGWIKEIRWKVRQQVYEELGGY